jgi:hypothetical protein
MIKLTPIATALTLSAFISTGVLAAKPNWSFVEGGYSSYETDDNFDPDGFTIGGKYLINKNIYANGEFQWLENNTGLTGDADYLTFTLGGGYIFPVNTTTDAYAGVNLERVDADGYNDNGFSVNAGIRSMLTTQVEVYGELGYYDLDDGDATLKLGGQYYFNDEFSIGGNLKFYDDADVIQVTARYTF